MTSDPARLASVPLLALLGALGVAAPAAARPFYIIHNTPNALTLLDPKSVQTLSGGPVRRATTITIQRSLTADGPAQPGYVRTLVDHDCERQQARWVRLSVFSRDGALVVEEANRQTAWTTPATTSETYASLRYACGQQTGYAVISADSIGHVVSAVMEGWTARAAQAAKAPPAKAPAKAPPAVKTPTR